MSRLGWIFFGSLAASPVVVCLDLFRVLLISCTQFRSISDFRFLLCGKSNRLWNSRSRIFGWLCATLLLAFAAFQDTELPIFPSNFTAALQEPDAEARTAFLAGIFA